MLSPRRACQSAHSVTFPSFPLLVSVLITALSESPPSSLFHLRLSLHTRRCLLLLSISLSFFGPASPSHTLTSPERSLLLPGFSLSSPLPISSTDRSLLHGRQKHRFFLRSLSSHSPLSVALFLVSDSRTLLSYISMPSAEDI